MYKKVYITYDIRKDTKYGIQRVNKVNVYILFFRKFYLYKFCINVNAVYIFIIVILL